ncbi:MULTISPECIES: nucleoside deaminase [Pseudonocardia]|uniref:Guanine deaminase n=2 Tax=Pseudonocardia TaxID=1847 RepID=A0A1Y2MV31_PSEAH|nr:MULTISPECIES: nucleoside deaminase [Pseudonocardia]OSY38508.1 Guanine deaminase [Pseudonocardia autotrophica]TDN77049.1 tRNA(Arg) A34 adenosine deaminase TadA [Pseudonocardia autotrophica]BBG01055.1 tRNA-specific adenosine deaminase [Pseudonocardia autotrophica]GEC26683.1 tRNA-specific adenosine deaminase [Pseudonocardia saturnea]
MSDTGEPGALARAVELAGQARARGDHPFGAVLLDAAGVVLGEARNTVVSDRDPTAHAELALLRAVPGGATLCASAEPCAMCAGAIGWSTVSRVVYALGRAELAGLTAGDGEGARTSLPCRTVLAAAPHPIEVEGPVPVPGAREVHAGYWMPQRADRIAGTAR